MSADSPLHRLAEAHGIQLRYLSEGQQWCIPSDASVQATLAAMGVHEGDPVPAAPATATAPDPSLHCFLPAWLKRSKCWGVTCQLYGLRSARNHGIGDFEDLARLGELAGAAGADVLGVNPLHALFTADPARCSPFSPSSRRFLNPLYIALDRLPGMNAAPEIDAATSARLGAADQVDYPAVAALKLGALRSLWRHAAMTDAAWAPGARDAFESVVATGGAALRGHALFEALSHHMVAQGHAAGWSDWPAAYRDPHSAEVARFADDHADEVRFHLWLQWLAEGQLAGAAARAQAAGLRIGLYLDLAVGNAPDGSATWMDPALVVPGAHIGAPPDSFFHGGQDWGLAPLSPFALRERRFAPYRDVLESTMRHAGAIRIDHAMSLTRLFWIPFGHPPRDGCYVAYPLAEMVRTVAETSAACRSIVIGEDLGTVPPGFSDIMRTADMLSCRVMFFEQTNRGFRAARSFPRNAFLSASTHDLPPLAAWWAAEDAALFQRLGLLDADGAEARRSERAGDRRRLLHRVRQEATRKPFAVAVPEECGDDSAFCSDLAAAIHAYLARTPSRILAVQFEDLCGAHAPVNVPGTHLEYPNWQLRAPAPLESVTNDAFCSAIVGAVAQERPRRA